MKQPARHDLIVVGLPRIDLAENPGYAPGLSVSRAAGDGVGERNADERRTCCYRCRMHASVLCASAEAELVPVACRFDIAMALALHATMAMQAGGV